MKSTTFLLCVLIYGVTSDVCIAQIKNPCTKLQSQAVDSLTSYFLSFRKRKTTLESSLKLVERAIKCDSSLFSPWHTKVTILSEMEEYRRAIETTDELFYHFNSDSGYLIPKPALYERLGLYDSARHLYGQLSLYFKNRLKDDPADDGLIYNYLFTKFKFSGWQSVSSEIDWYKKEYPNNANLKTILRSIHP